MPVIKIASRPIQPAAGNSYELSLARGNPDSIFAPSKTLAVDEAGYEVTIVAYEDGTHERSKK
jgi:hypothetical protein